jgi:2-keto-4-pentenoate hydratase
VPTYQNDSVAAGMAVQVAERRARIAAGERPIGWKLGFGTPAALAKFALTAPLVGYMMEKSLIASGTEADLSGWVKPVAEPEIAVRFGADVADGAALTTAAIEAFAPAIELADLFFPPEEAEKILAHNIYHRYVLHAPFRPAGADFDWSRLRGTVLRNGKAHAGVDDVEANTGRFVDILRTCADTLAAGGEHLRKGDIVILGSVVPPIFLAAADTEVAFEIAGAGRVSARLHGAA